jgi:protein-tyrosine phosphatase
MNAIMTEIEPQRHLALEGASNFRDLGGYETADGLRVRWRRIFRSNHLGDLSESDIARLKRLGLRKVIDFRSQGEIDKTSPCRVREADLHVLSIEPGIRPRLHDRLAAGEAITARDTAAIICDIYRRYLHTYSGNFRTLFDHLHDEGTPLVFHCAAGKDRTGIAAALILSSLGVPRDVILEDYLLTGVHWKIDPEHKSDLPADVANVLTSVDESFLHAAFNTLDDDFGGIEGYLREKLGFDRARHERLRELYLEG